LEEEAHFKEAFEEALGELKRRRVPASRLFFRYSLLFFW
jgi:hypothetical protein